MKYNALIIDSMIQTGIPGTAPGLPAKRITCRLTEQKSLTALFQAADLMNERPCQCLVVTDRDSMVETALRGGFDVTGSKELLESNP